MKILLTESQYSKLVSESTKQEELAKTLVNVVRNANLEETMRILIEIYGYSEDEIMNIPILSKLTISKFKHEIQYNYHYSKDIREKYRNIFSALIFKVSQDIIENYTNAYSAFLELNTLYDILPRTYPQSVGDKSIKEWKDGLLYDAIQYVFDNYDINGALKRVSILRDNAGYSKNDEIYPYVKSAAKKHGITIFPKVYGFTFRKKDGMIRQLINYLKDVEPKTKAGFLEYINSRRKGPGQHAYFWSSAIRGGIIVPVRKGNKVTYQLGPNYDAWENDKLIAF